MAFSQEKFEKNKKIEIFKKKYLHFRKRWCILNESTGNSKLTKRNGQLVKGLRRRPLTAKTRVRFPYWLLQNSENLTRTSVLVIFFAFRRYIDRVKQLTVGKTNDKINALKL